MQLVHASACKQLSPYTQGDQRKDAGSIANDNYGGNIARRGDSAAGKRERIPVQGAGNRAGKGGLCNLCKQPGHLAKQCPWPDGRCPHATCSHCGTTGHLAKACDFGLQANQVRLFNMHEKFCFVWVRSPTALQKGITLKAG